MLSLLCVVSSMNVLQGDVMAVRINLIGVNVNASRKVTAKNQLIVISLLTIFSLFCFCLQNFFFVPNCTDCV
jgi:hypothetical protein